MNTWTTPAELKAQLMRQWERGDLLRALAPADAMDAPTEFAMALKFKGPTSPEITSRFAEVREWVAQLAGLKHARITWREVRHAVMGEQRLPKGIWVDDAEAAIAWLGKRHEADAFLAMWALTCKRQAALLPWLCRSPLRVLALADTWISLLDVVDWRLAHPLPACYLREVDIPGLHSKFIEAHQKVLAELFDLVLPPDQIDPALAGAAGFAVRYGFLDKPVRLRLRVLDIGIRMVRGALQPDLTLDADSFAALDLGGAVRQVFITENETNFLAFPQAPASIVIFGAGYGWDALARVRWLNDCDIHYWGDIDTHGFAILDQLRARFTHVQSFLMDRDTLMAHETLWGREDKPVTHDLPRLGAAERTLYDELRDQRIRSGLRLEQERIAFHRVEAAVSRIAWGRGP